MIETYVDNALIVLFCAVIVALNLARMRRNRGNVYRKLWAVAMMAAAYAIVVQVLYLFRVVPPMLVFSTGTAALAFVLALNAIAGQRGGGHD